MSKSLIQVVNQSLQTVALNGVVSLGSVLRRFGCNCRLNGNAIEIDGEGYYTIDGAITVVPTTAGDATIAVYANGVQIPGAVFTSTATAGAPVTIPVVTTVRQGCGCNGATSLTCVLTAGPGNISNVSLRVEKA